MSILCERGWKCILHPASGGAKKATGEEVKTLVCLVVSAAQPMSGHFGSIFMHIRIHRNKIYYAFSRTHPESDQTSSEKFAWPLHHLNSLKDLKKFSNFTLTKSAAQKSLHKISDLYSERISSKPPFFTQFQAPLYQLPSKARVSCPAHTPLPLKALWRDLHLDAAPWRRNTQRRVSPTQVVFQPKAWPDIASPHIRGSGSSNIVPLPGHPGPWRLGVHVRFQGSWLVSPNLISFVGKNSINNH